MKCEKNRLISSPGLWTVISFTSDLLISRWMSQKRRRFRAIETPKREGFIVVEGGGILADFFVNQDSWMFHSAQAE